MQNLDVYCKYSDFEFDGNNLANVQPDQFQNLRIVNRSAVIEKGVTTITLKGSDIGAQGAGCWCPYITQSCTISPIQGGYTWAGSGPFSGCEFVVGKATINNNRTMFVAHIARESGSTAGASFDNYMAGNNPEIYFRNRILPPSHDFNSVTHTFVSFGPDGILKIINLGIQTKMPGASSGVIISVTDATGRDIL